MKLREFEIIAANAQRGRCIYCYHATWASQFEPQGMAMLRMRYRRNDKPENDYWKALGSLRATAEHLERQEDGGTDDTANIASACAFCNNSRGKRTPREWHDEVQAYQSLKVAVGSERIRLKHFLCIEAKPADVSERCDQLGICGKSFAVRSSPALIYPLYQGDSDVMGREYIWAHRKLLVGTRAYFRNPDEAVAIQQAFLPQIYATQF